jgi:hypothetical protein
MRHAHYRSLDALLATSNLLAADRLGVVWPHAADLFKPALVEATSGSRSTDVAREARRMRAEWRKQRYSRLKSS